MKTLIYRDKQFYLCDDIENKKGQTCVVSNYEPSPTNMPHQEFSTTNNDKTIVMYARPTCPHCIGFVDFLKENNKKTKFYDNLIYIEVDSESPKKLFSKKNILQYLNAEIGDHSTVPIVFYKGKFIGGADKSKQVLAKAAPKS
jgi:glutaredoxin